MLVLHIANKNYSSWSLRPWLVLRQLGIPFEERLHPFAASGVEDARAESWRALRAVSPSGKVPCLEDDGLVVWDSLAITEYLAERFPSVWPAEREARAFARCAAAEIHSSFTALRSQCSMSLGVRVALDRVTPELQADLDRLAALWQDGLARFGGPFLAGASFSAADAFFTPVAFRIQTYGLVVPPAAAAYAERLRALPAAAEWYADGLAETWRDEAHDAEVELFGRVTADLRSPA